MASNRLVVCNICNQEIEVRSGFAHETLNRHMKTHKE